MSDIIHKLICPDCKKEFDYMYKPDLIKGTRDKIVKELYLDCPNESCQETNKYTIEIDLKNGT